MTYRFVEEADRSWLHFSLRYLVPGRVVGQLINRARFTPSMERAVQRFLTCLAHSAGGGS